MMCCNNYECNWINFVLASLSLGIILIRIVPRDYIDPHTPFLSVGYYNCPASVLEILLAFQVSWEQQWCFTAKCFNWFLNMLILKYINFIENAIQKISAKWGQQISINNRSTYSLHIFAISSWLPSILYPHVLFWN